MMSAAPLFACSLVTVVYGATKRLCHVHACCYEPRMADERRGQAGAGGVPVPADAPRADPHRTAQHGRRRPCAARPRQAPQYPRAEKGKRGVSRTRSKTSRRRARATSVESDARAACRSTQAPSTAPRTLRSPSLPLPATWALCTRWARRMLSARKCTTGRQARTPARRTPTAAIALARRCRRQARRTAAAL